MRIYGMFRTGIVGRARIRIGIIFVLIIGIICYAGVSVLYSSSRVNAAERTLAVVIAHQNSLNATFSGIDTQLSALNSSSTFDSEQALTLVDRSIAGSSEAMRTVEGDDAALRADAANLRAMPWLSMVGRENVDHQVTRIGHARNALAAARTIAADELLDGRFWHALYTGLADFTTLNAQTSSGDAAGARATLAKMKVEIDEATRLSTAPGLPSSLHALMADLQKFVTDFGVTLDAQAAGDDNATLAATAVVDADASKIATYDIDTIGGEIDAYYAPMIERYNSEMAAAAG
jgi:hypothetical protein